MDRLSALAKELPWPVPSPDRVARVRAAVMASGAVARPARARSLRVRAFVAAFGIAAAAAAATTSAIYVARRGSSSDAPAVEKGERPLGEQRGSRPATKAIEEPPAVPLELLAEEAPSALPAVEPETVPTQPAPVRREKRMPVPRISSPPVAAPESPTELRAPSAAVSVTPAPSLPVEVTPSPIPAPPPVVDPAASATPEADRPRIAEPTDDAQRLRRERQEERREQQLERRERRRERREERRPR
jgi:fused signal recognition particle receptor